jgi:hypothetical protein
MASAAPKGRGDQAVHGGRSHLIALVPGAVDQELQGTGRLAPRQSERAGEAGGIEAQKLSGGGRCAERPCRRCGMKAARVVSRRIESEAEPAAHLVASDDRRHERAPARVRRLGRREGSGYDRGARMERACRVGVVEIKRMPERAVQQGGSRRRVGPRRADDRARAGAVEAEAAQHREHGRTGFGLCAAPSHVPGKIEDQPLGAAHHLAWQDLEGEARHIFRQLLRFVCHPDLPPRQSLWHPPPRDPLASP